MRKNIFKKSVSQLDQDLQAIAEITAAFRWIHVNGTTKKRLSEILPAAEIIADGDCGSAWGDYHSNNVTCPFPHVMIKYGSGEDVLELMRNEVTFIITSDDWSVALRQLHWREDPLCINRKSFPEDYRRPLGEAVAPL